MKPQIIPISLLCAASVVLPLHFETLCFLSSAPITDEDLVVVTLA